MIRDYSEVKHTIFDQLNPYDLMTNSYPLEERAMGIAERLYDQSEVMMDKAKKQIEQVQIDGSSTEQDIEHITLAIDYLTRTMARLRMADMIDPLSTPQKEKEPLVRLQESSNL